MTETAPFTLLIGGQPVTTAATLEVVNPATGKVFAHCPAAGAAELDAAVAAARRAFPAWRALGFAERAAHIARFAELLSAQAESLARLLTQEQGKPVGQSRDEIARGATLSVGMTKITIAPEVILDNAERYIELRYQPLGVAGIITPWNAPVNLAIGPLTSALYTGNCAIIKPSPFTPLTTLRIGELLNQVFPPGVVNVLAGGDELGALMTAHPGIDKISFTGSVATGKKVMASAAGTLKRVTLELGGNDAAIVLDDVDPKEIAPKLFFAAMVNSGQVCLAAKRVFVPEKIYDAVCAELAKIAEGAAVGNGLDEGVMFGPVQNRMQFEKVQAIIEDARQQGKVIAGGKPHQGKGFFIHPTVVSGLPDSARLVCEEQFGPVMPVLKYSSLDEVIARANASEYGLGGTVWSKDTERAVEVAKRLQTGTVWINKHLDLPPTVPYGGTKQSGFGVELGQQGLEEFTQLKIINIAK